MRKFYNDVVMNDDIYKNSTLDHSRDQLKAFQKMDGI